VPNEHRIHFAPFSLDLVNECLWKGSRSIKLRPKAFAVLEHLLSRPGQLVTKEDLIGAVWQDTFVGDAVLKVAIRQIREALSDDPKSPRFIETAHRRGYRFIGEIGAPVRTAAPSRTSPSDGAAAATRMGVDDLPRGFVGRERALSQMRGWFDKARGGERQVVFVTGEAGIGKTTLLEGFARSIGSDPAVRICSGQCLEQYGMSEAYLPVLDAVRQLCRRDAHAVEVLRAHAPMWLMQMPSLLTASDRDAFGREALAATPERMMREMGEALEALTARSPLVLMLEDLHWSDFSTLDLISYVARRRHAAHLMVVGTYRPAELIASRHPLKTVKQELVARQQCEELPLEYLTEEAVAQHLEVRFPAHRFPPELAALIHERTEGNPLFMVSTIDHLLAERLIDAQGDGWRLSAPLEAVKVGVPDSIRQLIETQVDRLDPLEQRILEAASVAGAEFPVAAVSAAVEHELTAVEFRCEELSRRHQFIKESGAEVLPDGQAVGRFRFVHAVYRHVLYGRLSASRRMQLHRRIGERGEQLYGARAGEIAAELAMHYEQAADGQRAARYLQQAAANAMQRSAYREAIALSRRGLELLRALPDTDERARQELWLHLTLGVPLIATEGYASPDVGVVYLAARELCDRLGATAEVSQVLWGLWTFHAVKAELSTALDIAGELLRLGGRVSDPDVAMRGHWATEVTCMHQGDFERALQEADQALSLYHPGQDRGAALVDALDPGVTIRCFAAWSLWFVGRPDRAVERIQEAVALARNISEPHGLAHALVFAAVLYQLRRERALAQQHADAAVALCDEHGLMLYQGMGRIVRGWALLGRTSDDRAADEIRAGLAVWQSTGARLMQPHFLALLTEAVPAGIGDDPGVRVLDEALRLAESMGERCYEAELHRLKGERLLARRGQSSRAEAEACFARALASARRQKALSLELRAAMSMAHLYGDSGADAAAARDLVMPIYARFEEGFDTLDLRDARALLDGLETGDPR
jgi:DNA-binding winged helix-turn-helix (wHTH) protein/predicted ATPase